MELEGELPLLLTISNLEHRLLRRANEDTLKNVAFLAENMLGLVSKVLRLSYFICEVGRLIITMLSLNENEMRKYPAPRNSHQTVLPSKCFEIHNQEIAICTIIFLTLVEGNKKCVNKKSLQQGYLQVNKS